MNPERSTPLASRSDRRGEVKTMERRNRVWMPIAAVLLSGVAPAIGRAQAPATPPGAPSTPAPAGPAPARAPAADPAPAPVRGAPDLPPALPSRPAQVGPLRSSGTGALATDMRLKPAPLLQNDFRFPINLATALRLSDARPLVVAAAQAGVWVAEAELTRAKVLWVPTLNIGFDYIRHDGGGPDFNKGVMTSPSTNF